MFMTEQAAGSDVGATATVARREGAHWLLTGDKWFCSNADADVALVLARPEGAPTGTKGLSLFLLPRLLPGGAPNRYRIVRLKDKLGTRDMASGEIRLDGALAYLVGEPERGFVQMADMINTSRLSNGMRAAGMMRRALTEAQFVAARRTAFGKVLADLPLMRRQLLKLMVPAEAARSMLFFAAAALEAADAGDEAARRRVRILTPLMKFRACRDARRVTGDAMEVRGGGGYIEEWPDARLLRDAHLGSIWEGTSNIVALDVARAIRKEGALEALAGGLDRLVADGEARRPARGRSRARVRAHDGLRARRLPTPETTLRRGRRRARSTTRPRRRCSRPKARVSASAATRGACCSRGSSSITRSCHATRSSTATPRARRPSRSDCSASNVCRRQRSPRCSARRGWRSAAAAVARSA